MVEKPYLKIYCLQATRCYGNVIIWICLLTYPYIYKTKRTAETDLNNLIMIKAKYAIEVNYILGIFTRFLLRLDKM